MSTWLEQAVPQGSDFPIENLPWGVCKTANGTRCICVAIGNSVADVRHWASSLAGSDADLPPGAAAALQKDTLNEYLELGRAVWGQVRKRLQAALHAYDPAAANAPQHGKIQMIPQADVEMVLPVKVGDYTDFYCSKEHATNVGALFRGRENALQPNCTQLGESIALQDATDHIFGYMLMNDCSARDIQKWEYVPLGPFNGKNFATVVAPWIVQHEALQPFMVDAPPQDPLPLPYLARVRDQVPHIHMTAAIQPQGSEMAHQTCHAHFRDVYWTFQQMLAHHTIGGCNIAAGDIIASGTVSSPAGSVKACSGQVGAEQASGNAARTFGCLLELTHAGKDPIVLAPDAQRKWLQDGDRVCMRAWCEKAGLRIGFGACDFHLLPPLLSK